MDEQERNSYWDHLKGILIFLVVFGHYLYHLRLELPVKTIVDIIYFFHMPAFILISGFFSKRPNALSSKSLLKLAVIYLIMNTPLLIYLILTKQQFHWLSPVYSAWYLFALLIWRVSARIIKKFHFSSSITLFSSVIVALMIGFWEDVSNVLAMSRIFTFFPFFLLGYWLPDSVAFSLEKKSRLSLLLGLISFCLIGFIAYSLSKLSSISSNLLMEPYMETGDMFIRIVIFLVAISFIGSLFVLVPHKTNKLAWLSKWGKNSLWIFILHRPFTLVFAQLFPAYTGMTIPISVFLSFTTVFILGADFVCKPLQSCLNDAIDSFYRNKPDKKTTSNNKKMIALSLFLVCAISVMPLFFYSTQNKKMKQTKPDRSFIPVMPIEVEKEFQQAVSIAFVGDLLLLQDQLRSGYDWNTDQYDYSSVFQYAKPYLSAADYAIGVYEGPSAGPELGYSTSNFDDGIPLEINLPDSFAHAVKESGIDLVTNANNHLLDKGLDGALRTIDLLDRIGLDHTGSYKHTKDKQTVKLIKVKNITFAVLSYTFGINGYTEDQLMGEDYSFITSLLAYKDSQYFQKVKKDVEEDFKRAKSLNPDFILVLPHMGTQFLHETDAYQELWNNIFIENGADIIFGDHAHAVQPIEFKKSLNKALSSKTTLIVHCPGNFANSYTALDGDASAIVYAYIDPDSKKIVGTSVQPVWVQGMSDHSFRALPVWDIFQNKDLLNQLGSIEIIRAKEVCRLVTRVMLGTEIPADQLQQYNYRTEKQCWRVRVKGMTLSDTLQKSSLYGLLLNASQICFIGDSITEGTKNGGVGWYEPLAEALQKSYSQQAWGGATTRILIDKMSELTSQKADIFVIAIGTNDVRYQNKKICAMNPEDYVKNIQDIRQSIHLAFPESIIVFIAPWGSQPNDIATTLSIKDKEEKLRQYREALRLYCIDNHLLFIDPNPLIEAYLEKVSPDDYLVDYIHPNIQKGIYLYCEKILEASIPMKR